MQATKVKGVIDGAGKLVINEPINLTPGEVEVILLQAVNEQLSTPKRQSPSQVTVLKEWFEKTETTPDNFDPKQARWEALKEKYDL